MSKLLEAVMLHSVDTIKLAVSGDNNHKGL